MAMKPYRDNTEKVNTKKGQSKKKGLLIVVVTTLIFILIANFLISYKIIINRNRRVGKLFDLNTGSDTADSIRIFIYDELYMMDSEINSGIYRDGADFISRLGTEKVWFSDTNTAVSDNGYMVHKISAKKYSNKPPLKIYTCNSEEKKSLKSIMKYELYTNLRHKNIFIVDLVKEYRIKDTDKVIRLTAKINLEYGENNRDILHPDKEILKELEASLETNETI